MRQPLVDHHVWKRVFLDRGPFDRASHVSPDAVRLESRLELLHILVTLPVVLFDRQQLKGADAQRIDGRRQLARRLLQLIDPVQPADETNEGSAGGRPSTAVVAS